MTVKIPAYLLCGTGAAIARTLKAMVCDAMNVQRNIERSFCN